MHELVVLPLVHILAREFNENCVVLHGSRYGELYPWSHNSCSKGYIIGFPRARAVLEAQARILKFLWRVIDVLVPGSVEAESPSSATTLSPVPHITQASTNDSKDMPWARFDPAAFLTKARAQLEAAEDHL
jgi:hypothetical protein